MLVNVSFSPGHIELNTAADDQDNITQETWTDSGATGAKFPQRPRSGPSTRQQRTVHTMHLPPIALTREAFSVVRARFPRTH